MAVGNNTTSKDPAGQQNGLVQYLTQSARMQPTKAAVTGLLVMVLLVLTIRLCIRQQPAAAAVTGAATASTGAASSLAIPVETSVLGAPGTDDPMPDWRMMRTRAAIPRVLTRDMFAVNLRGYTRLNGDSDDASAEKPDADVAALRAETLRRQAAGFRLEGTVIGPLSAAFVDGTCIHVGDEYRGFRVKSIGEQCVVLERDGVQLELHMPEQ